VHRINDARWSGSLDAVKHVWIFTSRGSRPMTLSKSRIRTDHRKSMGKTEDQAEKLHYVDHVDCGGSKLVWRIALISDILEACRVGNAEVTELWGGVSTEGGNVGSMCSGNHTERNVTGSLKNILVLS
jgi:hypothetical protein